MADNFGLKIGVEGEKEFKSALRDINQSFKVLGSEMNLVKAQFDKNDKSVQGAAAKNTVLSKEIDAQKEKIALLKDALDNSTQSFGENDKRTQAWQTQLNNAKAQLLGMEQELENNNKALLSNAERYDALGTEIDATTREYVKVRNEYGENSEEAKALEAKLNDLADQQRDAGMAADEEDKQITEVTKSLGLYERGTEDAADATEETSSKLDKACSAFKTVGGILAGVVTAVGTATTTVGVGMFHMAQSAADAGREVNATSQKLGLSREGFQEWDFILKKSGTSIDVLGTGMKTLQKTMGGLTEDGDKASDAFAAIGISFDEIKGKSPEEALNITIKALQDLPPGADRTTAALKLFGKGAMELQPLLNKTSAETDELRQRAHDLGLVLGDEQVDSAVTFKAAMGRIQDTMEGMKLQLASSLVPAFADGLSAFLDFANGVEGGEEKMKSAVDNITQAISTTLPEFVEQGTQMITALVTGVSTALPGIADAIASVLPQLVGVITEMVPKLIDTIMGIVPSVLAALLSALPAVTEAAVQIILALVNGLSSMLPELIPIAIEAIMAIVTGLLGNLDPLLSAALQLILALADAILTALPQLIAALPAIIQALVDFLISAIPQIIDAGIKLLISLVEALPQIITAIVAAIPLIIDGILTAVLSALPQLVEAGIKLLVSLIKSLPKIIVTIVKAIPKIITAIISAIVGNIDKIIVAGVKLLVALVKNLPSIIVAVVKAIPQIIVALVKAIIDAVPKMAKAGADLIKGLWQGISDVAGWIWDKVKGFMKGLTDKIKDFFGISSPSTLFAEIGKNMGLGIGVGFGDVMEKVSGDMQDAIPTTLEAPKLNLGERLRTALSDASVFPAFAFALSDGSSMQAPNTYHVTQNIYGEQESYAGQQQAAMRQFRRLARTI